jgi:hypothetical protein
MEKEEGIFTIAEDEMVCEEEIFVVAEEEVYSPISKEEEVEPDTNDWLKSRNVDDFVIFIKKEFGRIKQPKDLINAKTCTLEQSLGQWKKLNTYISYAIRSDYAGKLNSEWLDKVRDIIEKNIEEIEVRLAGWGQMAKDKKMRRKAEEESELVKEATAAKYMGLQTNMTLFETAIVRMLINGTVSGGRNIEELYEIAKDKYEITPREELALFQALSDMGYPTFKDRLKLGDDDQDPSDSKNIGEWQSQYYS